MKQKQARRFVVGYSGEKENTVYGRRHYLDPCCKTATAFDYCHSMTAKQAAVVAALEPLPSAGKTIVFELVPVELPG